MIATFLLSIIFPGEWVWEDQSYRMNSGLDFRSGEVVFTDLDADEDEEWKGEGCWKPNQALIEGIACAGIQFLGAGDMNGDGREEVVLGGEGLEAFVGKTNVCVADGTLRNALNIRGTPALCDADGDKKLDLFIGGAHHFHNASTGGVQKQCEGTVSMPQRICMVRGAELSLRVDEPGEASVAVYETAGKRVACLKRMPEGGKISFRLKQPSGVYFCRVKQGNFLVNTSVLLLN